MGYSLRSWDYRFTLWLGFNPNTFQVGESFFTFLWGVAAIKRVVQYCVEDTSCDIRLILSLGECI